MRRIKRNIKKILVFTLLPLLIPALFVISKGIFLAENNGKIPSDLMENLAANPPEHALSIIVQYYEEPSGVDYSLLNDLNATILSELDLINGLLIEIPAGSIEELSQSKRVKNLSPDRNVKACMNIASSAVGTHYYIPYYNLTGRGVTVAVLDSGIISSNELTDRSGHSRIVANIDLVQDQPISGHDYYGHGSYIAGIIAMKKHRSDSGVLYFSGIAPDASIASIRVLDKFGKGKTSNVIKGIEWCVNNSFQYGIRIINLSLSHPIYESFTTDPLTQACEKAWKSGLIVIAPAGNHGQDSNGYGTIGSPANDPYIITVGATDDLNTINKDDDMIPAFSSKGPTLIDYILKPDILAPGNSIFSIRVPESYLDLNFTENRVSLDGISYPYFKLNGTSISSAIVSGAAAVMLEKEPFLSPSTVKARLMRSADKYQMANIYHRGAGFLNIEAALLDTGIAASSLSPKVFRTNSNILLENINWGDPGFCEEQEIWGSYINWGENDIYNDASLWDNTAPN